MTHRIAIFASGSGTNAENIFRFFSSDNQFNVGLIVADNPNAGVLERAKKLGVEAVVLSPGQARQGNEILSVLEARRINFVALAGYLRLVPAEVVQRFQGKMVNIHPALLPAYGGKGMYGHHVHQAVLDAGENFSGITVHFVNEHYDEGDVLLQAKCRVLPGDTPDTLAARIHALEYRFYPQAIAALLEDKIF